MSPESRKRLRDAHVACAEVTSFVTAETVVSFRRNRLLRLAVQHLLVIGGEALSVLRRADGSLADSIPDLHRFIGMRNHLVHGYEAVSLDIVWQVASEEVPKFAAHVSALLVDELGEAP